MENIIAILVFSSGVISLLYLLILHFVRREFDPGWRMISEYALGKDPTPPEKLPEGVIACAGYANRLLVLCYVMWLVQVAGIFFGKY